MAWTVDWAVSIGGQSRTSAMRALLMDISVTDKEGSASDSCELTFDDSDGLIALEGEGQSVEVALAGVDVFSGTLDSIRSSGSRSGGRIVRMSAKGFDVRGKAKEPQSFHADNASLEEFLSQAAKNAGFSLMLDPALASIERDWWAAENESFLALGQRLAREHHGTFKLRDKKAVLVKRGGEQLAPVRGIVGQSGNVISWDIAPFTGRGTWTKARVEWFDRKQGSYRQKDAEIDLGRNLPEATNTVRLHAGDDKQAQAIVEGRKGEAEREGGEGSVELDITPEAQAEAPFILSGARPGVDGTYRIGSVTHRAGRSSGATTSLELKQPSGEAGKDGRSGAGEQN